MKVAIVSIRFDTKGGSERRTYQLARGLTGAGHEVEIFAAHVSDMDLRAKVNIVPMSTGPSFIKVASFTKNAGRMLAERPDIDVVHNQIRPFTDGVVTVGGGCHAEYLKRSGAGLLSRYLNPLNFVVLRMEKARYRPGGCRAVITNSEFSKKGLLSSYPIPPEDVYVAYNGVDSDRFSPKSSSYLSEKIRHDYGLRGKTVVLFVGNGFKRKGLTTLIKAMALLRNTPAGERFRLLVVGKDRPGKYKRLADWLKVEGKVTFAGQVKDPEGYYGAADIFALPTRYDPFSNSALEAMSCGLPVITTLQNGVSEIIKDGVSGLVMDDPDDHRGLSEMLVSLSDEAARKKMGAEARRLAEGFTWDKTLERTLEVYRASAAHRAVSGRVVSRA